MGKLKKLAGQTAIYGVSSIIGRLLNYLLVPIYTRIFAPEEYGIVSEFYAYISFLVVIYTLGMETGFFHYSHRHKEEKVYNHSLFSIFSIVLILTAIIAIFAPQIALVLEYPGYVELIYYVALILAFDAISAIPFALLRRREKAKKFAVIKIINISLNIALNLFFLLLCPYIIKTGQPGFAVSIVNFFYSPGFEVRYVFISNMIASIATTLILSKELLQFRVKIDKHLLPEMLKYSAPLIIVGLAGMVNETIDRILLKQLLPGDLNHRLAQIGIYSACYKLAIFMTLVIQAFRMGAEPFFFAEAKEESAPHTFARIMKYFVALGSLIFLGVMLYLHIFKHLIGEEYHEGLHIVPILLLANLFLGIYYNLSIWYKIRDKTNIGAIISISGALLTIILNVVWIPLIGYEGSAWATFICYFMMAAISYQLGQKYYPVPYPLGRILIIILASILVYGLSLAGEEYLTRHSLLLTMGMNTLLLAVYIAWLLRTENLNFALLLRKIKKPRT